MAQQSRRPSHHFSDYEDAGRRRVHFSEFLLDSPSPRADRRTVSFFADHESESNFLERVQSLSFAGSTTVNIFGCYEIHDNVEDTVYSSNSNSIEDENIIRALQESWSASEKNRNLSQVADESENQIYQYNVQYHTQFSYTDSFYRLQQSIVAGNESVNKNKVGEWLHYMISNFVLSCSAWAGKVTGMFLELFTVPEILAQIYDFSKLANLCIQALDAISLNQVQE